MLDSIFILNCVFIDQLIVFENENVENQLTIKNMYEILET